MVRSVWNPWWRVVTRRDPWIAVVWLLVGGVFLLSLLTLAVVSTAVPHILFSPAYHAGLVVPQRVPGVEALGAMGVLLLTLGGLPLGLAGLWSLYGQAVHDRVHWGTFWRLGWHYYDRGWALIAAVVLYGGMLSLVGMVLRAMSPVLTILLIPMATLSAPLMIRVVGGLFVDGLPWPQSVRRAFVWRGYGTLVWGTVWAAVAVAGLAVTSLAALQMSGFLGASLIVLAIAFTTVAGPLWLLTLYSVTAPVADEVGGCLRADHLNPGQDLSDKDRARRAFFTGRQVRG